MENENGASGRARSAKDYANVLILANSDWSSSRMAIYIKIPSKKAKTPTGCLRKRRIVSSKLANMIGPVGRRILSEKLLNFEAALATRRTFSGLL